MRGKMVRKVGGYTGLLLGCALLIAGCAGAPADPGLEATPQQKGLFPVYYIQQMPGGAVTELTIGSDLEFEWEQPLASRKTKVARGTLKITGTREARAGRIRLEWVSRNGVTARSPYGTSMETGGSGGSSQGIVGADFNLRRQ